LKKRLDALLVEKGLATGRDKAKALIMAGEVYVNGQKALKSGEEINPESLLELRGGTADRRYASRGGLKLEKAMEVFGLPVNDAVCADIGASTGGFTDCMLRHGAAKVYAVDVGYGQLAWTLRSDPRVVVLERTNARYLSNEQIPEPLDFASIDVSFISLALILPALYGLLKDEGHALCLIKPQFEAGREKVGKKGVVRDPGVHTEVIGKITGFAQSAGFAALGLDYSPITGPRGNIEYLLYIVKSGLKSDINCGLIAATVQAACANLRGEQ